MLVGVLGESLDRSSRTGTAVLGWQGDPIADALPLRLAAGLHALVRGGHAPALAALYPPQPLPPLPALVTAVRAVLADRMIDAWLLPWLDSAPQTNEVGRSGVLMPGLMAIAALAGPGLRLFELGASAGLNLGLDHWRYRLGALDFGPAHSAVRLTPHWRGAPPPTAAIDITERRGVDINPIDVTDPAAAARLIAYVWPDQPSRVARAAAAIAATAAQPPAIDRADAADWVEAQVALAAGTTTVVLHSIAFQYFPPTTQARIAAHLAAVGAGASTQAPLAWLRYEPDSAAAGVTPALRLTLWRGGAPEERLLAHAHPHGSKITWL